MGSYFGPPMMQPTGGLPPGGYGMQLPDWAAPQGPTPPIPYAGGNTSLGGPLDMSGIASALGKAQQPGQPQQPGMAPMPPAAGPMPWHPMALGALMAQRLGIGGGPGPFQGGNPLQALLGNVG